MQRILSTAVIVGLLAATAAAFAITERLKLTKSPITGTKIVREYLSPRAHTTAAINVRFRRSDLTTVTMLDSHRHDVDTIAFRVLVPRGRRTFTWSGLTDAGTRAKDGTYRMEIHLANQHRTILIPKEIVLDSVAPLVRTASSRDSFSPEGDHQSDSLAIHYTLSEHARVVIYLSGHKILGPSHSGKPQGKITWYGRDGGMLLPPGVYTLELGAIDAAGNETPAADRWPLRIRLRYIALANHRIIGVAPGPTPTMW